MLFVITIGINFIGNIISYLSNILFFIFQNRREEKKTKEFTNKHFMRPRAFRIQHGFFFARAHAKTEN